MTVKKSKEKVPERTVTCVTCNAAVKVGRYYCPDNLKYTCSNCRGIVPPEKKRYFKEEKVHVAPNSG